MKSILKSLFFFAFLFCLTAIVAYSQSSESNLTALRNQFAIKYLQPASHFALAKYYLQKGNKIQAFYILEYARRYRFSEKEFDQNYTIFFGAFQQIPSKIAQAEFKKGNELLKQNKPDEAETALVKAAKLAPESELIQSWVGRFFFKAKQDNAKALEYYFNAYFRYPHAYETEFVESRIRQITLQNAKIEFEGLQKQGKTLTEISENENPIIVGKALEEMSKNWKPEYFEPFLECMKNDDSFVRWSAFVVIYKNAGSKFEEILPKLLNDKDLRKRGLAAYSLIEYWKDKGFEILKKMLGEKVELIRFDATSALALEGAEKGLEILKSHQKSETNPYLISLISQALKKKKD